jgi:hypothetical protein
MGSFTTLVSGTQASVFTCSSFFPQADARTVSAQIIHSLAEGKRMAMSFLNGAKIKQIPMELLYPIPSAGYQALVVLN